MLLGIVAFAAGLFVGWNFFAQPKVIKDWYDSFRT